MSEALYYTLTYNGNTDHTFKAGTLATCTVNLESEHVHTNTRVQAASNLENLQFNESPLKQPVFTPENKENMPAPLEPLPTATIEDLKKPVTEIIKTSQEAPLVAPGIKATEADEPLLQENPNRFVLFPLK